MYSEIVKQTTTNMKHADIFSFWLLKKLLQMNSYSLVIEQKQKRLGKQKYMCIWGLSFETKL